MLADDWARGYTTGSWGTPAPTAAPEGGMDWSKLLQRGAPMMLAMGTSLAQTPKRGDSQFSQMMGALGKAGQSYIMSEELKKILKKYLAGESSLSNIKLTE